MFGIYRFWEDGRVMTIVCVIISVILLTIVWNLTNGFKELSWKTWIPLIVCVPVMIFCISMSLLPNGTGGVTQHFYLGFFMYSLCTLIFTGGAELVILAINHFLKK